MSTEADIVERLRERWLQLSGRSIDRGCLDSGISADLCDAAADLIERLTAERDAAARDMRERAAMAVRNKICTIPWPPEDGDELIDSLMAVVRALPDTPAVIATDRKDAT